MMCARRALEVGFVAAFVAGLGAACADAAYAALAASALGLVTHQLAVLARPLHLAGGRALVALGVRGMTAPSVGERATRDAIHPISGFTSTFALTLANPTTIFSFAAVVASASFASRPPTFGAILGLICGTFVGSAAWWFVLAATLGTLRRSVPPKIVRCLSYASNAVLTAFGIVAIVAVR